MKIVLKMTVRFAMAIALLIAGFAAGFPIGQRMGFSTGTEWAIVQADILARQAGLSMPVFFEEGAFRVVVKQPPDIYRRAWQLADRHDKDMKDWSDGKRTLSEKAALKTRSSYLTQ